MPLQQPALSDAAIRRTLVVGRSARRGLCLTAWPLLATVVLFFGAAGEGSVVSSLFIAGVLLLAGLALLAVEHGALPIRVSMQWFVVAYSLRVSFAVLVHLAAVTVDDSPFLFRDESSFYSWAERLLSAWHDGTIVGQSPIWYQRGCWGWIHIVGFVRFVGSILGGDTSLNIRLVNCAAGALVIPYVYGIAHTVFGRRTAHVAAGFTFLLPDYWFFSATLLRDAFVSFAIVLVLYQVLMLVSGRFRWWRLVFVFFVNFGVLPFLRIYVPFLIAGIAVGCVLWDCSHRWPASRFVPLLLGTSMVILLAFGLLTVTTPAGSYRDPRKLLQTQRLLDRGIDRYTDSSVEKASEGSLGVLLLRLPVYVRVPVSAVRLVLLPIPPWGAIQIGARNGFTRPLMETVAALVWYALLPFLMVGVAEVLRNRQASAVWVWVPAAVFIFVLAINTGLTARWRLMPMPFLLVMIARGWIVKARYRQLAGLTALLLIAMLALYIQVKYLISDLGLFVLLIMAILAFLFCAAGVWKRRPGQGDPVRSPVGRLSLEDGKGA